MHQAFQRLPDEHFAFRIETRSWFIQDEQRGIFKKRARNSDTLRLTSAQTRPALPNLSFVAAWQLIDELRRAREFGRLDDFLRARRWPRHTDIRQHIAIEEIGPLWYQGNIFTPRFNGQR